MAISRDIYARRFVAMMAARGRVEEEAPPSEDSFNIILEDGSGAILTEDGDKIITEDAP